jgi:hypothetical protein
MAMAYTHFCVGSEWVSVMGRDGVGISLELLTLISYKFSHAGYPYF